jgi:hypothetical protein
MKHVSVKFVPGDRVRCGDIRGHISCVSVTWPDKARYEFTWWDSGQRREVWCDDFEIVDEGGPEVAKKDEEFKEVVSGFVRAWGAA